MWRHRLLRFATLLAPAALALHQLRYLLDHGAHLGDRAHGYLAPLAAGVAVLVALAALALAGTVLQRGPGACGAAAPSLPRAWARASGALLVLYLLQEWVEGELASGHPHGVGAVIGDGGPVALALALALGGLIALVERRTPAATAAALAARPRVPRPRLALLCARAAVPGVVVRPRIDVLAGHLAGRAPPRGA